MDDTTAMRKLAQMMLIICVHCVTFLARYCDHNEAAVFPLLSGGRRLVRGEQESRSSECGPQWSPSPRHQLLGPCSGHWSCMGHGSTGRSYHVSVVCNEGTNKWFNCSQFWTPTAPQRFDELFCIDVLITYTLYIIYTFYTLPCTITTLPLSLWHWPKMLITRKEYENVKSCVSTSYFMLICFWEWKCFK